MKVDWLFTKKVSSFFFLYWNLFNRYSWEDFLSPDLVIVHQIKLLNTKLELDQIKEVKTWQQRNLLSCQLILSGCFSNIFYWHPLKIILCFSKNHTFGYDKDDFLKKKKILLLMDVKKNMLKKRPEKIFLTAEKISFLPSFNLFKF